MKFISCDYNGIEICTVAQTLLDLGLGTELADYLNSGPTPRDPHLLLGSKWHEFKTGMPVTPDDMQVRRAQGDVVVEQSRKEAKAPNLSFHGGAGNSRLSVMSKGVVNTEQVAQLRKLLYEVSPGSANYLGNKGWVGQQKHCNSVYRTYGYEYNGRWRNYCTYAACANGRSMQSPAADGAKEALWLIFKDLYPLGCNIVAFIHDEVLLEVPDDKVWEAAERLSQAMCVGMHKVVPNVRIAVEFSIMPRWTKEESEWLGAGRAWINSDGQFCFERKEETSGRVN